MPKSQILELLESPESIAGCASLYGFPLPPNGPCCKCGIKKLCRKLSKMLALSGFFGVFRDGEEV
jgi:hypothetical protein